MTLSTFPKVNIKYFIGFTENKEYEVGCTQKTKNMYLGYTTP